MSCDIYYCDLSYLEQVLCILWEMDVEEVEDILQVFVNKSLLFCDRNKRSFRYYLHDLQLDFLTEQNHDQLMVELISINIFYCSSFCILDFLYTLVLL